MSLPITSMAATTLPTKQGIISLFVCMSVFKARTSRVYLNTSVYINSPIFFLPSKAFAKTKIVPPVQGEVVISVCKY